MQAERVQTEKQAVEARWAGELITRQDKPIVLIVSWFTR